MKFAQVLEQSPFGRLALAVVPVVLVFFLGQLATFPSLVPWYEGLVKPSFNPPNWIFGPVWTALYILMIVAVWRILKIPLEVRGRSAALAMFFLQLVLNALWSWLFFAGHSPLLGLVDIVPQLFVIVLTIYLFGALDKTAGLCLGPLAVWVGFAAMLNFEIWRLNG